jgi:hypothetical protein
MSGFDRYYSAFIFWGLIAAVWFAALFEAAHNLWAASLYFGAVSLMGLVFCIGRFRDSKPVRFPLIGPLALLLLAFRLSLWQSWDVETGWLEFWGWTFTVLLFYLSVNVMESDADVERFMTWAGAVVVPLLGYCLWQRFGPPQVPPEGLKPTVGLFGYGYLTVPFSQVLLGKTLHVRYGQWEIHASLINSVVMAGFVLYWTLFYGMKAKRDWRELGMGLCCIAVLAFSRSWWAFIALIVSAGIYSRDALRRFAATHKKKAALALGFLVFFLAAAVYIKTHHGVERAADSTYYHASSRWYYWLAALHMWERFPWTGVGLGGYATAFPHFKLGQVENTLFAHGGVPQMLSETGVFGLTAWIVLVIAYVHLRLTKRAASRHTPLQRALDATLISVLFYSLLSINLDFLLNKFTFFLLLAGTLVSRPLKTYPIRPLWAVTAGLSLILLSSLWLNLLTASRLYASGVYWERQGNVLKAVDLYTSAISVEPFHADSYWQLSRLYSASYKRTHSADELSAARMYLQKAIHYKKDIRYFKDLENLK